MGGLRILVTRIRFSNRDPVAGALPLGAPATGSPQPAASIGRMSYRELEQFVRELPSEGSFSVWAGPVEGPSWVAHRDHTPHYAASTMKLALVVAAYRSAEAGLLDLDDPVAVHNSFTSAAGGATFSLDETEDSDPQPWLRRGQHVALRWLAYRSIVRSSNLATNLLLDHVGTTAVGEALEAVGATDSVVSRGIEDTDAREAGLQNVVTARDLALTLQALVAGTAAGRTSCDEIVSVLAAQQINDAIPAGLPPGTRVAHKSGWVEGISHDAAIVYPDDAAPFVVVVCTTSSLDERSGLELIAAGARAAWADRRRE
jgi:beta-lactamase class A